MRCRPQTTAGAAQGAANSGAYRHARQQCQRRLSWQMRPQPEELAAIWAQSLCRKPLAWGLPSGVACFARLSPNRASASRVPRCQRLLLPPAELFEQVLQPGRLPGFRRGRERFVERRITTSGPRDLGRRRRHFVALPACKPVVDEIDGELAMLKRPALTLEFVH